MTKPSPKPMIRLRGVRQNNLKQIDLDLPLGRLIVITGLSGSGKSSLAFDTLFAEGQRRYIETFSPYARQFFDRMDKPQVDHIEGIPPAIAIEQRNAVRTTRSTVGTLTEICDYAKLVWQHLSQLYCRQCNQPVHKDSPSQIWEKAVANLEKNGTVSTGSEVIIAFDLPLSEKLALRDSLALVSKQGYQRLLINGEIIRLEDVAPRLAEAQIRSLTIIQDRIKGVRASRARFVEACEQAYHFGKGRLTLYFLCPSSSTQSLAIDSPLVLSNRLHCANCDIEYREPVPALFSFNHPLGACPTCHGFGRTINIDYDLAVPDHSKTLAGGLVKPWQSGVSAECQDDMLKFCRRRKVPTDVPFEKLPKPMQDWVLNGDPGYGQDKQHEWPHAWYGVKGYFRWLESKSYKMHVRVLLSRYRQYRTCPDCQAKRFQPEALLFKVDAADGSGLLSLADFYLLPIRDALRFIDNLAVKYAPHPSNPMGVALNEVRSRLGYLVEVGLGYLTLDRTTRSLSGGETERVNLTTCLGTRLVNTLFVLDEPSVGLHSRDTERLVRILQWLRDAGNTVVVVEHEPGVMRAADQIVDLGPGSGESGGRVVFQGNFQEILESKSSLTGQYLSGAKRVEIPQRRPVSSPILTISHATLNNLQDLTVNIPLGRFVCVTGVSGSGKTTLVREVLLPALEARLKTQVTDSPSDESTQDTDGAQTGDSPTPTFNDLSIVDGWQQLGRVVIVDQSILGKTPRSNPAVYTGAFADLRELFAHTDLARQRGLSASSFSFNSREGQCERCHGAGFEKIEMQFLSDVFIRCPDCNGRRYRPHILEIKLSPPSTHSELRSESKTRGKTPAANKKTVIQPPSKTQNSKSDTNWSIADLLDATLDEAVDFLGCFGDSRPAHRAIQSLRLLQEVGLGYLRLGQPINTLSGGECQRLKLVRHLAEFNRSGSQDLKPTLFLFDEPTTGLHFDDVRVLLKVFQRLVDAGHSMVVIEHNLEVIKCADWLIDLGPEAGDQGGRIVTQGTPEQVATCPESHTGRALRHVGVGG